MLMPMAWARLVCVVWFCKNLLLQIKFSSTLFVFIIITLELSEFKISLMKKLIIFSSLLLGTLCFSQSVVEKYNSIYKRYEYFDSIGNLIGYKSYNNLSRQWEYFTVQPQNTKQPYKYRDPAKLDLGIDTFNQQSGNKQINAQAVVDNIINRIKSLDISDSKKNQILDDFTQTVNQNMRTISNGNVDWLYDVVNTIISENLKR